MGRSGVGHIKLVGGVMRDAWYVMRCLTWVDLGLYWGVMCES